MYLHSNSQAQWYHVLNDLQLETSIELPLEIEHYLILTLIKGSEHLPLLETVIADDFLHLLNQPFAHKHWRELGDRCLLLNGLFPLWTERRSRTKSYYARIGRLAYQQAAMQHYDYHQKVFEHLSQHFDEITFFLNHVDGLAQKQ